MDTDPRDAADRRVLAHSRALIPGDPPSPWRWSAVIPASGGYAAGWDAEENVVLISADGYSVTTAHAGERLLRDRDSSRTYLALSDRSLHFTLPHTGATIDVFGLISGDGIHYSPDGWELDVLYPWYPRATTVLAAPEPPGAQVAYFDHAHALRLTRLADWEWLRSGFSPSGLHFLLVGAGGAEVFTRASR